MIDLSYTRAAFLAQIEMPDPAPVPLSDITDPRVASGDAHICVCGHERDDLFPLLKIALSERFARVPRQELCRDLLIPLRNALGNACKHGNGRDPAKRVCVEILLTRKGVVVAITDEGAGFDVALTFRRFQEQQSYFANHGCGFRNLHTASSTVTYENGGRTVLLCFRPKADLGDPPASGQLFATAEPMIAMRESPPEDPIAHEPVTANIGLGRLQPANRTLVPDESSLPVRFMAPKHDFGMMEEELDKSLCAATSAKLLPESLDSGWIQARLSAALPEFENSIESCRIYSTHGRAGDDCGHRYVLRIAGPDREPARTRILTGRLHATVEEAAADSEAATRLREANISKRVLIPKPVARLAGESHLVLYEFDPWMNLGEYLVYRGSLKSVRHSAERIGQALAGLHRSLIVFHGVESRVGEDLGTIVTGAETILQALPSGADCAHRLRVCVQRIQERIAVDGQRPLVPVHGAFGWNCIYYGVDSRFYLYRFETCRRAEPGLDLGGFAADLLCFALAKHDEEIYRIGCDALLGDYNSNAEYPIGAEDLRFYIAIALCERLRRAKARPHAPVGRLVEALDVALSDRAMAEK
jgi:anti-sigma regulatory factor (Ser/Thr protein kinase)